METSDLQNRESLTRFAMYLLASASPNKGPAYHPEFQIFTPAPWELSEDFPPYIYGELGGTVSPRAIAEAALVLESVMKRCGTTSARKALIEGIGTLKRYRLIDDGLLWAAVFSAANLGWHITDVEAILDATMLSLKVPPRLGRIFPLPLHVQIRKLERLTEDFPAHPSRYAKFFSWEEKRLKRMLNRDDRRLGEQRIYKALKVREKISNAAAGRFTGPANVEDYDELVNELVAAIALASGQEQNRSAWFSSALGEGSLSDADLETLLLHCKKQSDVLRPEEREYLLAEMQNLKSAKLFSIALEYALEMSDVELLFSILRTYEQTPHVRSSRVLNQLVQRFLVPQKDFETLGRVLNNPDLSSYLDLRAFVYLKSSAKPEILNDFLGVVFENPEAYDFGIYVFAVARREIQSDSEESSDLQTSHETYMRNRLLASERVGALQSADLLQAFLELAFLQHAFFIRALGSLMDQSPITLKAEKVHQYFVSSDSELSLETLSHLLSEEDLSTSISFMVSQVAGLEQSDTQAVKIVELITQAFRRGIATSKTSLVQVFVYLASGGSLQSRQSLMDKLCQFPAPEIESSISAALFELARVRPEVNFADELQRVAAANGLSIRLGAQAASANADFERGTLFDRYTFQGPDQESWNSLSLILDDVIHELNQPIASVANWVKGLEVRFLKGSISDQEVKTALGNVLGSLGDIEDRMLDYRALTDGGSEPTWIELNLELHGVVDSLKALAKSSSVTLTVTDSYLQGKHYIFSDAFKFRLMIRNLIRNAVNAIAQTGKPGLVEVNIYNHPKSKLDVMIQVRDDGPGVPENIQASLFEKGIKSRDGRGLGLGLALAQSVASALGGNLRLQSTGPSGTTFIIHMRTQTSLVRPPDEGHLLLEPWEIDRESEGRNA